MKKMTTRLRGIVATTAAALLAVTLATPAAYADGDPATTKAQPYDGTTYHVAVFGGNQGTLAAGDAAGQTELRFDAVAPGELFSFEDIAVEVPEDSKYYAKGIRLAALDNVRSDRNRDGATQIGDETVYYARPAADGTMVDQRETVVDGEIVAGALVNEDMDFVVAYGIKANRVAYTVEYVDADTGEALREAETFFGDIGDVPAMAPHYIEGYLPQATLMELVLSSDEAKNVATFEYKRLPEEVITELKPDGTVDFVVSDVNTTPSDDTNGGAGDGTGTDTAPGTGTGTATGGSTVTGAYSTVVQPGAAAAAADGAAPAPLLTDDGQEVLADDGTPLAAPGYERIEDDDTALSSGAGLGESVPEPSTAWIPWAVAAGIIACAIVLILVNARRKQKAEEA